MLTVQKIISGIVLSLVLLLSGCSRAEPRANALVDSVINKNILIVYLSRTKNTEAVGKMIQQRVGGELVALELQHPYPENYQAIVQQVQKENETGYLPPLKTNIDSLEKYEIIFLGFPTWGMQLPPPMKSFLSSYDFGSRTIIPFNTNAGYGMGSSLETIKQLCPNSLIMDAFSTKGGIEREGVLFVMKGDKETAVEQEVETWLRKIGF